MLCWLVMPWWTARPAVGADMSHACRQAGRHTLCMTLSLLAAAGSLSQQSVNSQSTFSQVKLTPGSSRPARS
jgi:hypothetical protein